MKGSNIDVDSRNNVILCFLVCSITALVSFVYFIAKGKGAFTVVDDFNAQQIPFNVAMHHAVSNGGEWNWAIDLGTSNIFGFSFYGLGGIYAWITMLFPAKSVPYVIGWIYILKYIVAGMTSFYWLKQFVQNERYAIIGALLYAFSGFQTANLEFYHFHDVVSFFPLLLIGIDRVMKDNEDDIYRKRFLSRGCLFFTFVVAINCLCNYYFFVEECVFIIIYFIIRYMVQVNWKRSIKPFLQCLIFGGLGVAISAILFLPNIFYILQNPRSESSISLSSFFPDKMYSLFLLKNYFFPAEPMREISAIFPHNWNSTSAYLPLIGLTGVFAYLWKDKKSWLSRFIKILIVMSFIPFLSSAFLMFTESNQRWFFMMILIFSASSIIVIENRHEYKLKRSLVVNGSCIIILYLLISYVKWNNGDKDVLVFNKERFLLYAVLALSGIVIYAGITKSRQKYYLRNLLIGVIAFSILTTSVTLHFYRSTTDTTTKYMKSFNIATQLETIDEQYRYRLDQSYFGLLSSEEAGGVSSFSSTISQSIKKFDSMFDYSSSNRTMRKSSIHGLTELLGGKYSLTQDPSEAENAIRTYTTEGATYYVVEHNACPIGYAVDKFLPWDEVHSLPVDYRGMAMLQAVIFDENDVPALQDDASISKDSVENIQKTLEGLGEENYQGYIEQIVEKNKQNAVSDFTRNGYGFTCTCSYDQDKYIYFSVPNDDGWTAYVDGVKTRIIDSCGMMVIKVPEGFHKIEFTYNTPYFGTGIKITLASLLIFLTLIFLNCSKNRKDAKTK